MITPTNKLIEESIHDLLEDFDELLYLVLSQRKKLELFITEINKVKSNLRSVVVKNILDNATKCINSADDYVNEIEKSKESCSKIVSTKQLNHVYQKKLTLFENIRTLYSETASLITALDWQSPSYLHSRFSMAGKQTGRIVGTMNDYKRDHSLDALALENSFKKEYIDSFFKLPIQVCATSSGMAAFTTILNFLQMKQKITGPILIGKSIYFENKTLVQNIFGNNVVEVDENNTERVCEIITRIKPSVIMFDSLTNTSNISVPNLTEIIKYLIKTTSKETYLIIDNTTLSISYQILKRTIGKSTTLHTIVFESLNKYYQFGMDRVTGGIIWVHGKEGFDLFKTREYSGTNIADISAQAMPTPNRKLLTRRLARLGRNALFLASSLQQFVEQNKTIVSNIVYPGLPNHQSFSWSKNASFHGSFFIIAFKQKFRKISIYKKFVEEVIEEAKKQQVDLIAGTSFGFNTTRVYLTALHSEFGDPFIRVSVGTEPRAYIEKVNNVFINVMDTMK